MKGVITMVVKRVLSGITLCIFCLVQLGCYNVHNVSLDEFSKAQEGGLSGVVSMKTEKEAEVVVSENSRIGVLYNDGRYQSISPFNFTLTSKQLIAPDQDLMVNRSDLKTGQVKEVSKGKTTALVSSALAVLVGGILFITLSAEEKKGFGER